MLLVYLLTIIRTNKFQKQRVFSTLHFLKLPSEGRLHKPHIETDQFSSNLSNFEKIQKISKIQQQKNPATQKKKK